jgi:hypothetical protein
VKRLGPAGAISDTTREDAVFTRFDAPDHVPSLLPNGVRPIASRGARLLIPAAAAMRVPGVGALLHRAEWALCDSKLHRFAGFWMLAAKKD